jgi:hypothetical protein
MTRTTGKFGDDICESCPDKAQAIEKDKEIERLKAKIASIESVSDKEIIISGMDDSSYTTQHDIDIFKKATERHITQEFSQENEK